ncbi:hypothetical protein DEALK_06550 [Dehalogenimonas alkenigignens]|uniref:Uncharacterized protein n=1 Tax=Dehalogenimonas alkenigignens TaxID=1217799 RepID=A0A0W0GGY1_9CHLR|nr:hypothetical protein [Dehalogenimonas alkenigignens]KTB47810.1 hypothetical protein DEALK_06550 [Dehalogenimonas alkenigignens]
METQKAEPKTKEPEDLIADLDEGPWPGPIEYAVPSKELSIGTGVLRDCEKLTVCKHKKRSHWWLTASAQVNPEKCKQIRWDYRASVTTTDQSERKFGGTCVAAHYLPGKPLELSFHDHSLELTRTPITLYSFGLSNKELMYWIPLLAGLPGSNVPDLIHDQQLRPFIYAVPIQGLEMKDQKRMLWITDMGISGGEMDDVVYPIVNKLKIDERHPEWRKGTPHVFGVVMAKTLLEAEEFGLERARLTIDVINFALKTGVSHLETRRQSELLGWNCEYLESNIKLTDWIFIREVQSIKGWIRIPKIQPDKQQLDLESISQRLLIFIRRFQKIFTEGGVACQTGKHVLSKTENKLISGLQRAIHWYAIGSSEVSILDKFLGCWIALESVLDTISYPAVFSGTGKPVKHTLEKAITSIQYPKNAEELLTISPEMLQRRLLASDWPLSRKLELFAKSIGVQLQNGDVALIQRLGKLRGQALHCGNRDSGISALMMRELEYLTERLIIGASICAYKKIEDGRIHEIKILPLGPEGGAAPLLLDGKDVGYEFYLQTNDKGEQTEEWVIEGIIYNETNSKIV